MSKLAVCDVCGADDDIDMGNGPFLDGGALFYVWEDDSQTDDTSEAKRVMLCVKCKQKLLKMWPELSKFIDGPEV